MKDQESFMLFNDLKKSFTQQAPRLFEQMYKGLESGDAYTIKRAVHTLKNSCCCLDLANMAELCRTIEASANKGLSSHSEVSILLQRLEKAYDLNRQ